MIEDIGRVARDTPQATLNEEGPWGSGEDRAPGGRKGGEPNGPRNPWSQPPRRKPRAPKPEGQPSIEELIRRGRDRFSGGWGGGLSGGGRPIWAYALAAFVALWLISTSAHRIEPQERGVITRFGRYAGTLKPGFGLTLPAPADVVTRVNVDERRSFDVPASGGPNLLLTRERNLVDLAYTVTWSVRDPDLYLFDLAAPPEDTIRDAAQSAMREAVAGLSLDQVTAAGQGGIAARVTARLQDLLDRYRAGVQVQSVVVRQAGLPAQLADAAKEAADAQAAAQGAIADAQRERAETIANAQANVKTFDKVYEAYKVSPQVTRTRMYYDMMEAVLAKTDKVIVDVPNATVNLPPPVPRKQPAPTAQPGNGP
jgi:membrane protease subunit HflK